jgi:phosphate uptake regulator
MNIYSKIYIFQNQSCINMKRHVIKQGHNTLTITLPAKWAEDHNVKPGDELEIADKGEYLAISREAGEEKPLSISMALGDADIDLLKRYVNTLYKIGYDDIRLSFNNSEVIQCIQDILQRNLIGYEIISQTKNSCEIRSLSMIIDSEFDNSLNRIFLLLFSLAEEILSSLKSGDLNHLKNAALLEENNNRLTTYCRRILNKKGYAGNRLTFIYYIVEQLEKIADEFKYIARHVDGSKALAKKVDKEVLRYFSDVIVFMRMYYSLFYLEETGTEKEKQKIREIYDKKKELLRLQYEMLGNTKSINSLIMHHLIVVTQGIWDIVPHEIALRIK